MSQHTDALQAKDMSQHLASILQSVKHLFIEFI